MKILFINSPECDYMQDLLYSGLVKLHGADAVFEYPFHRRYRFIDKKYPRNLGYNPGVATLKRLFQSVDQKFDLVIVGSCKHLCLKSYMEIAHKIPKSVPVVFIDGGDQTAIGGDLIYYKSEFVISNVEKTRPFDLIFKREYLIGNSYEDRIVPLPFCFNLDRTPKSLPLNKKYDVAFWAVESDPIRVKALDVLQNHFDCKENGTTRHQTFKKYKRKGTFYLEELARCKISLSFRGGGWDTMRYWETPAVGSFMMTQKPGIVIPNDFVNGEHVIYCREDMSDIVELCEYYLKNPEKREAIAVAGQNHLLKHHTDLSRAKAVFGALQEKLKVSFTATK
ncbi:MAG: glycosyltransferase [Bdellovibrionaceae bacterium]|nr:glycosyltransferase [Pseudobdellovibrionaceae bacterium]